MILANLARSAHKVKFLLDDHSTTILTAAGVGGTVATAVLTGRASFKAAEIISKEQREKEEELRFPETHVSLTTGTKVKLVWLHFLPPFAMGATTITCIIMANKISSKKIAALAVAGGISERALQEYKDKVAEKLGERQNRAMRDEIAQERVKKNPPQSGEVLIVGSGKVLCYDMLTGRYFHSTMEDIKRAENKVNYELINFMYASLSQFYDEIGLPPTPYTDSVGWNMDNHMEVQFSTVFSEDNQPCIAIDFSRPPVSDYDRTKY